MWTTACTRFALPISKAHRSWFTCAAHATSALCADYIPPYAISADWPGEACTATAMRLACPALFAQGSCGDAMPRTGDGYTPRMSIEEAGSLVATSVSEAEPIAEPARLDQSIAPLRSVVLPTDPSGEPGDMPFELEVQAIRLGSVAIVALNVEPFGAFSADVSARSPFQETIVVGYTNGCVGYLPDQASFLDPPQDCDYELIDAPRYYGTGRLTAEAPRLARDVTLEALRTIVT